MINDDNKKGHIVIVLVVMVLYFLTTFVFVVLPIMSAKSIVSGGDLSTETMAGFVPFSVAVIALVIRAARKVS